MRRMAPPLPAASQPSKTRIVETSLALRLPLQQIEASLLTLEGGVEVLRIETPGHVEPIEHVEVAFDLIEHRSGAARCACRLAAFRPPNRLGALEAAADGVAQHRPHRHAPIALVFALDDVPGGLVVAGAANRAIGRGHEAIEHAPVAPRVLAHAPPAQRVLLPGLEPFLLRGLSQMHPELQDDDAIIGERALEGRDLVQQRIELVRRDPVRDAVADG